MSPLSGMKSLSGLVFLLFGLAPARAALIYEPFGYTVGSDLAGQSPNGGTDTWAATGTGGAGGTDPIIVASGSLTVPGLALSGGNSIAYGGAGLTDRISIGGAQSSGTLYYSFAFRVDDVTGLSASGGFMAGFNTTTGTQATQPTTVGARLLTRASGSGYQIGIERNSGTAANFIFDTTERSAGTTIFVVGSYTFNAGAGNDECRLWINPSILDFGAAAAPPPTLTAPSAGTDLASIASFLFRQGSAAAVPPSVVADELRVDTTWAGVTPVPEPGASALIALAGAILARRRPRT
jgi:hypothetical protein